jgi:hypothetical protein
MLGLIKGILKHLTEKEYALMAEKYGFLGSFCQEWTFLVKLNVKPFGF